MLQEWERIDATFKKLTIYSERLKDKQIIIIKIISPVLGLEAGPDTGICVCNFLISDPEGGRPVEKRKRK